MLNICERDVLSRKTLSTLQGLKRYTNPPTRTDVRNFRKEPY